MDTCFGIRKNGKSWSEEDIVFDEETFSFDDSSSEDWIRQQNELEKPTDEDIIKENKIEENRNESVKETGGNTEELTQDIEL